VKVILWIALLLVLIASGLLIVLQTLDWDSYRPKLEEIVREATGRDLSIEGELEFMLLPAPSLSADDLSFSNASWGSQRNMLEASSITLSIAPRALLSGKIRLRSIALNQASLLFESNAQGLGNWDFGDNGGGESLSLFEDLVSIDINGLDIEWQPDGKKPNHLAIDKARLSRPLLLPEANFSAVGFLEDIPISLEGSITSIPNYLSGQGIHGKIKRTSPNLEIELEGNFGRLPAIDGLDITLVARGSRWPLAAALIGLPTGETPPWRINANLAGSRKKWALTHLDAQFGESKLTGSFDGVLNGTRPRVKGRIKVNKLDLTTPGLWRAGGSPADKSTSGKLFSDQPVTTAWMGAVDLDIVVKAGQLLTEKMILDNADVSTKLVNGSLTVTADAQAFGGQATALLKAQAVGETLQLQYRLELIDADAGLVTRLWSQPPPIEGKGDLNYELSGVGQSTAEYMAHANGSFRLLVGEGNARVGIADRAVRGLIVNMLSSLLAAENQEQVKMNCIASHVTITNGIAAFDVLVLDTDHSTLVGSGSADLGREIWDIKFKPRPKHATLNSAVSITLTGPFSEPKVSVSKVDLLKKLAGSASIFVFPPAAVASLGELGSGDNVCLKFISEGAPAG
jgi:uncharacterized protein involved in outer membrane biogenesis